MGVGRGPRAPPAHSPDPQEPGLARFPSPIRALPGVSSSEIKARVCEGWALASQRGSRQPSQAQPLPVTLALETLLLHQEGVGGCSQQLGARQRGLGIPLWPC